MAGGVAQLERVRYMFLYERRHAKQQTGLAQLRHGQRVVVGGMRHLVDAKGWRGTRDKGMTWESGSAFFNRWLVARGEAGEINGW